MTTNEMKMFQERAERMKVYQLLGAMRDCSKSAKLWAGYPQQGFYMDEMSIYASELKKRKESRDF